MTGGASFNAITVQSYRAQLKKIGELGTNGVSYRGFFEVPSPLSVGLKLMEPPGQFELLTEKSIHENWTEQCQGVAWDGSHWLFSSNGSQPVNGIPVGSSPKAVYTFNPNTDFSGDQVISSVVIATVIPGLPEPTLVVPGPAGYGHHVGTLFCFEGKVFVDHFATSGESATLVLNNQGGNLSFSHWIVLEQVAGQRMGLVGINPFDSTLLTAFGDGCIDQLFVHAMDGKRIGDRALTLSPPIDDGRWVQGGAITEHGHIYISSGKADTGSYQNIYCYSLLNGRLLQTIPVLSKDSKQELEGICYAPITRNGQAVQLHGILLDEHWASNDGIFFKSFGAPDPQFD